MKFWEYTTGYAAAKQEPTILSYIGNRSIEEFYDDMKTLASIKSYFPLVVRQCENELAWYKAKRPYYSVWPKITEPLSRLDLSSVKADRVKLPLPVLAFRFTETDRTFVLEERQLPLRAILALHNKKKREMVLWLDLNERAADGTRVWSWRRFPLLPGKTVAECQEVIEKQEYWQTKDLEMLSHELSRRIVSLVVACCLIDDEDIVSPDLLSKDRGKNFTWGLVERAHRRGKIGWDVGKKTEMNTSPHFRRPHLALFHVGPGRKKSIVKLRKGSFVKRQKAVKVPTGYQG